MRGFLCQGKLWLPPRPSCIPVPETTSSDDVAGVLQFTTERSTRRNLPSTPEFRLKREVADQRCSVKGCVFPATSAEGTCVQHDRQRQEPSLFSSQQPSTLLLDRAKFGVPDSEPDNSRANDRRRLARIRENFLDGVA